MHIAICDDNIADRKQLERLLKRESDKQNGVREPFYIDSYGNPDAVMHSPMLYDTFFIDMTSSHKNGYEITMDLIHAGVTVPIILCISGINYQEFELPENCYFLQKPIRVNELSNMLEIVFTAMDNKIPHIELRTKAETLYVLEQDIMYATHDGHFLQVHLKDETCVEVPDTIENFYESVKQMPCFLPVSTKAIVNVAFIKQVRRFSVYTKNGCKFFLHPTFRKYVYCMFKEYVGVVR